MRYIFLAAIFILASIVVHAQPSVNEIVFFGGPGITNTGTQVYSIRADGFSTFPQGAVNEVVPRAGVEPARPYGQRILSPLDSVSPSLTKRCEPVFTGLAVVKVSLRLVTYQHVPPPS
jgi:hypothetical protein